MSEATLVELNSCWERLTRMMPAAASEDPVAPQVTDGLAAASATSSQRPQVMKAKDALNHLSPIVGGPAAAKDLIIDQLYQGKLRAFASRQWRASGRDLPALWKAEPPADAVRKGQIDRTLFRPCAALEEDRKTWNWVSGRFSVTSRKRPNTRHMMRPVRFAQEDIEAIAKTYGAKSGRGGRPTETAAWTEFWMEVVRMAVSGELTKETQVNREKFRHDLFHRLGWDQPHWEGKPPLMVTTLKLPTGKIWDRFIEPKPGS